jgi:hypothetical protein
MKTIHSLFFTLSFLFISICSIAGNPWPDVAALKWDVKDQRVMISWTAPSDAPDLQYVIEKSSDGKTFSSEAIIMGGFEVQGQFEFSHRFKYIPGTQYRIKQMNNAGHSRIIDSKIF